MELPLSEIIDRLTILKLKIERVGEPHLDQEYEKYREAIKEFEQKGIVVRQEWFDTLYDINRQIWDLDWDLRKIVSLGVTADEVWQVAREELGHEEVGRRAGLIIQLVQKRIMCKNEIVEVTGIGYREIKKNH